MWWPMARECGGEVGQDGEGRKKRKGKREENGWPKVVVAKGRLVGGRLLPGK